MGKNENIEFKRILDILKSKILLIVFILICSTLLGYVYSYYYVIPEYKSTATLLLIPNETSENKTITSADLNLNAELISTYSNIAKQPKIIKQVITNLNLNMTEQEFLKKMQVRILPSTYIIELSITNTQSQMAMRINKELSNVFLNEIKEIYNLDNIGIIDEASMPDLPDNVNHLKDIAMFFAGGIGICAMMVICIYIFDNTVKAEEDIERYIKIKTLGKIPLNTNSKHEIVDRKDAKSYVTECINTIRTNILYMNSVKGSKAILITSCTPREGKSWVSSNIAAAFAETNKKVLLVDCDMRKGRQHRIFGMSNKEGLSNYLYAMIGDIQKDAKLGKNYIKETHIPNLHILTNGNIPPNPSELIDSPIMQEFITMTKSMYDIVIIDAPPCKLVTDSIILSTMVDSTILVSSAAKTKISDLKEVRKSIEIVGGKIIGGILNQVKMTQKAYGNTYYYGHASKEHKVQVKEKAMISVDEVIDEAIVKLKNKKNIELPEKQEIVLQEEPKQEMIISQENIVNQDHLEEVIHTLSDIKIQLKNNIMENKLNDQEKAQRLEELITQKIEELEQNNRTSIKEEIQNIDMTNELNRILTELENVKANFQITKDDLEYTIKKGMLSKEEVEDIVKNEIVAKEQIKEIMRQELANVNYAEPINQMANKIEEVNQNFDSIHNHIEHMKQGQLTKNQVDEIITNKMLSKETVEEIITNNVLNKEVVEDLITSNMLTKQNIEDIIANNMITKETIGSIVKDEMITPEVIENMIKANASNKQDVEQIENKLQMIQQNFENMYQYIESVKQELLKAENVENIVKKNTLTKQEIEETITSKMLNKEIVEDIITSSMLTRENIQEIVSNEKLTKEQIEEAIGQKLESTDYTEQINQINEKMANLQESYLEILNLIKTKQIDLEEIDSKNVIPMKSFKKQEEKKKRVYSIQEEIIPYQELEKTAICIIPLKSENAEYEAAQ